MEYCVSMEDYDWYIYILKEGRLLANKLVDQGYSLEKLTIYFRKFNGRCNDLLLLFTLRCVATACKVYSSYIFVARCPVISPCYACWDEFYLYKDVVLQVRVVLMYNELVVILSRPSQMYVFLFILLSVSRYRDLTFTYRTTRHNTLEEIIIGEWSRTEHQ